MTQVYFDASWRLKDIIQYCFKEAFITMVIAASVPVRKMWSVCVCVCVCVCVPVVDVDERDVCKNCLKPVLRRLSVWLGRQRVD